MSDVRQDARDSRSDTGFFGQPGVLANLFGVELWERFSFYGMQGILLIYLYYSAAKGGLGIDEGVATGIVGAYGGAVYLSTILGAWLADRVIGPERTLFYAAVCVMGGHIALALLPGLVGVGVGLVLIALGSGGVKANATSLVGSLYDEHDPRRDAGFSLFYMGINIGAFIGPLLTGLLQKEVGFHWGFGAAAVGMALGLTQYALFRGRLPEETHHVANPLPAGRLVRYVAGAVVVVALVVVLVGVDVITADRLSDIVIGISLVAAIGYFALILTDKQVTGVERSRIFAFIPLFVCNVVFWSLYQQQFTVVTIYADKRLDRDLFGWQMPVSWVNSINPVFIIVLAGVFAALWTRLGDRAPVTPLKFGAGTALMGIAFFAFLPMPGGENTAPLLGIVGILLLFTLAELLISPVGLSATTKLAPKKFRTQMVGLYFLSIALGTAMAGTLAGYYDETAETPFFLWVGLASVVTGVVVMFASKPIHKLMAGVD
ncbi:MFS transporter [Nocardioides sp. Root122]|uniref:peptide MFS transporter n=1 Tax=Nocardioides TaxID=1839 RepID=UPI0007027DE4|nr:MULTISPECIES: oligopeptide:H+ symporter [Nocardioides]KQV77312.1 MFS transporter [Nocardioides sp. Root122]MCK9825471.1 oligopeptide:H+ symporter [Nocardioides cavernae]